MTQLPPVPAFDETLGQDALAVFMADLRTWRFRSVSQAARYFRLDRSTVWRYEEGRHTPPVGYVAALAVLLVERLAETGQDTTEQRHHLLGAINQALLVCYPDVAMFRDWSALRAAAAAYRAVDNTAPVLPSAASDTADRSNRSKHGATTADWGETPDVEIFFGRSRDLDWLQQRIHSDRCRVVAILGMGGIGKTVLAARIAQHLAAAFDCIFWRSLINQPPPALLLTDYLRFLTDAPETELPERMDEQLRLVLRHFKERRCLLILDNFESVLQSGSWAGPYHADYAAYGQLVRLAGETDHQSCVLITSREQPKELQRLETAARTARHVGSLMLGAMDRAGSRELLHRLGIVVDDSVLMALQKRCSGNPKILEIVAAVIRDEYGGAVDAFLREESIIFGDVRETVAQQVERLTPLEVEIMDRLAVAREPLTLPQLRSQTRTDASNQYLRDGLHALRRRSLLEQHGSGTLASDVGRITTPTYWLQNAVMEYMSEQVIDAICQEIVARHPVRLCRYALLNTATAEHIRSSQDRMFVAAIATRLQAQLGNTGLRVAVHAILARLRDDPTRACYAPGNLLNLLLSINLDPAVFDFSRLPIWHANLRGHWLPGLNLAYSDLSDSIFTKNFGSVRCVAWSGDGKMIAAGTSNGDVHIWSTTDTQQHRVLETDAWIETVAFSPDGSLLASAGADQVIQFWDVANGRVLARLEGHTSTVRSLSFNARADVLASGSDDGTVRVWDVQNHRCQQILRSGGTVWSLAFSPHGSWLASAGSGVRVWNTQTWQLRRLLHASDQWTMSIAASPDGRRLAGGGYDRVLRIWDVNSGVCQWEFNGHYQEIRAVAWSPDDQTVASGSEDGSIRLWSLRSGHQERLLDARHNRIRTLAFSPTGHRLVSGSHDQNLRLWNSGSGHCLDLIQGYTNQIRSLRVAADGRHLAVGVAETVQLFDLTDGSRLRQLVGHRDWVQAIVFSPDGNHLMSASDDQHIRVWNLSTGVCEQVLRGHRSWVQALTLLPEQRLASSSADGTIKIWDLARSMCEHTLEGHNNHTWTICSSPDGRLLASGGADQSIRLWDVQSGKAVCVLPGHSTAIWSLAFSPDGQTLYSGSHDGNLRVWDLTTGSCQAVWAGHSGRVVSVVVSRDGTTVASSSDDRTIRLWNRIDGSCRAVLAGAQRAVVAIDLNPDGTLLVSGSEDGMVRVWNVWSGALQQTLVMPQPYTDMDISGVQGLSRAQRRALGALGAIEQQEAVAQA